MAESQPALSTAEHARAEASVPKRQEASSAARAAHRGRREPGRRCAGDQGQQGRGLGLLGAGTAEPARPSVGRRVRGMVNASEFGSGQASSWGGAMARKTKGGRGDRWWGSHRSTWKARRAQGGAGDDEATTTVSGSEVEDEGEQLDAGVRSSSWSM